MTNLSGRLPRPRLKRPRRKRRTSRIQISRRGSECLEDTMQEFGVRRYGDAVYHHCLADAAADAAAWFAQARPGMAGKNFQALVKDVSKPGTDEAGDRRETSGLAGAPRPSFAGGGDSRVP